MKFKKGEFIVHNVTGDGLIRVEYKDRVIQMYPHGEEIWYMFCYDIWFV